MGSSITALFAGLCTLDVLQAVERVPGANEKVTALDQTIAAGGPAANAAVTFAHLGGDATLVTGVGRHPLAAGVRADLGRAGVRLADAAGDDDRPPPVSSIVVTAATGDRSVVSRNAAGRAVAPPAGLPSLVSEARAVLVDGHHPALADAAAREARARGVPCVLDGGSWKGNTAALLPCVDVAVCSADFRPPGSGQDVLEFLLRAGVRWAAVTDGPRPVAWAGPDGLAGTVPVPAAEVADTLGAGDVFHGAFLHAIASGGEVLDETAFTAALRFAGEVAARSCESFGTRAWMGY
ncbi:MAG: PfkB family carbohydrate kinase [Streptosporangiales bacterium]|nr:PfkB family carbohydrate kinase [Streptosporangiales bacterium]